MAELLAHPTAMQEVSRLNPASYLCWNTRGEVTGCHTGCHKVSRCHTRGESQETYIMYASTEWNPEETSLETKIKHNGISSPTKMTYVLQNIFFRKKCLKIDLYEKNWFISAIFNAIANRVQNFRDYFFCLDEGRNGDVLGIGRSKVSGALLHWHRHILH